MSNPVVRVGWNFLEDKVIQRRRDVPANVDKSLKSVRRRIENEGICESRFLRFICM